MRENLYPMLLKPACSLRPWGSDRLSGLFALPAGDQPPGEVYLALTDSEVSNGALAGTTLGEIAAMGVDYMGRRRSIDGFPLIIKILATGQPLALQVHPSDTAARQNKELRVNFKSWYILDAEEGCKVHAEMRADFTRQQLLSRLGSSQLTETVNSFDLVPGDSYYLPSGRVHGVDAGAVILAIEQNNPTTFVVGSGEFQEYDTATPIETTVASQYINFNDRTMPRNVRDQTKDTTRNRKIGLVTTNPVFILEELRLATKMHHRTGNESYNIVVPLDAPIDVIAAGQSIEVKPYHACFVPAKTGSYTTTPSSPTRVIRVS